MVNSWDLGTIEDFSEDLRVWRKPGALHRLIAVWKIWLDHVKDDILKFMKGRTSVLRNLIQRLKPALNTSTDWHFWWFSTIFRRLQTPSHISRLAHQQVVVWKSRLLQSIDDVTDTHQLLIDLDSWTWVKSKCQTCRAHTKVRCQETGHNTVQNMTLKADYFEIDAFGWQIQYKLHRF